MDDTRNPAGTEGGDLGDRDLTAKDRSYSPSSERETAAKQDDPTGDDVMPGTGGPDDTGDVDVPPEDDLDPATIVQRGDPGPGPVDTDHVGTDDVGGRRPGDG
ncbi:hypothetical protein P5G50_01265 [Leifsonia sp. F6_8S_P_1B]|uniref:Uncharacterized protein n=1 Tax=Leifsonia williamsii TaxID=3035919 RepID=A0ABT8K8D1_9MICO|nr:hypothetical protein [Leifsonia williamsii]MDN4613066.1 hypothetical protein [Leifsonia williamsii]